MPSEPLAGGTQFRTPDEDIRRTILSHPHRSDRWIAQNMFVEEYRVTRLRKTMPARDKLPSQSNSKFARSLVLTGADNSRPAAEVASKELLKRIHALLAKRGA